MGKKLALTVPGIFLVIIGSTLILAWWPDVVSFFRGIVGMALAVSGLLVLYSVSKG